MLYLLTSRVLIFSDLHRKVHNAYTTKSRARGKRDMPKRKAVAVELVGCGEYRGGVRFQLLVVS